jgi:hypothetical protein
VLTPAIATTGAVPVIPTVADDVERIEA